MKAELNIDLYSRLSILNFQLLEDPRVNKDKETQLSNLLKVHQQPNNDVNHIRRREISHN
jgi:hypothetical protein